MKYSMFTKILAMTLAVLTLTAALLGGAGLAFAKNVGEEYNSWLSRCREEEAMRLATALAESYATRTLGGFTRQELQIIGWGNDPEDIGRMRSLTDGSWCYSIARNGLVYETDYTKAFDGVESFRFELAVSYPVRTTVREDWNDAYYMEPVYTGNEETEPTVMPGSEMLYTRMEESSKYVVTVYFKEDAINAYKGLPLYSCKLLMQLQDWMVIALCAGLFLGLLCLIWLLSMAGRSGETEQVKLAGLCRIPLDIHAAAAGILCVMCMSVARVCGLELLYYNSRPTAFFGICGAVMLLAGVIVVLLFLYALVAQLKTGISNLVKRTALGWCVTRLWNVLGICGKVLCKLYNLLPLIWQYLLTAVAMVGVPFLFCLLSIASYGFGRAFWMMCFFVSLLADCVLVLYGAYAFGTLLRGAKHMAEGDMTAKVPLNRLYGVYKHGGEYLNALSEAAVAAARSQMKSERMKAELITNVSHDIKTPLTSVINYIDLLQKAETEQQRQEYLQVLERQSQRLKKLIEDLMDMSKASTGNVNVEIQSLDAVETVNQALGEFSDKLTAQQLTVIFAPPERAVSMQADGKLTWRVFSNVLSNAVKYALPGTRVYVDIEETERFVTVSVKNISREPLNISAEELMERFVRGDASRNTEGSGLGLNIAQSLMQLQKGNLTLTIDGDLFKTTLQFPK